MISIDLRVLNTNQYERDAYSMHITNDYMNVNIWVFKQKKTRKKLPFEGVYVS